MDMELVEGMLQPHSHCLLCIWMSDFCISCGRWAQSLCFCTCNRLGLETHPRGSMWPRGRRSTALDGKLLVVPGPFPVNLCEVLYIVHSEEFINKCLLSLFRNASPSICPPSTFFVKATLLPVQGAGLSQAGAGLLHLLLLQMLWEEAGCNWDRVALGLQKQPPALGTVDCHHLGSGPLFDTLSLCSSGQLSPALG